MDVSWTFHENSIYRPFLDHCLTLLNMFYQLKYLLMNNKPLEIIKLEITNCHERVMNMSWTFHEHSVHRPYFLILQEILLEHDFR